MSLAATKRVIARRSLRHHPGNASATSDSTAGLMTLAASSRPWIWRSTSVPSTRAGVRTFINLMEEDETNYAGEPFSPYADLARELCPDVHCVRHPIQDLFVPTHNEMEVILTAVDESLAAKRPVYVHCWGGVGRTGTVSGCWLLRHHHAISTDVMRILMELRKQDREETPPDVPGNSGTAAVREAVARTGDRGMKLSTFQQCIGLVVAIVICFAAAAWAVS